MQNYKLISTLLSGAFFMKEDQAKNLFPLVSAVLNGKPAVQDAKMEVIRTEKESDYFKIGHRYYHIHEGIVYVDHMLIGGVVKYDADCSYGTDTLKSDLITLDHSPKVKAIILRTDSPGGSAAGTRNLYQTISNLEKPLVAFVDGMACSAGYYAIAGADYIIASQPTDSIGSIGAYTTLYDLSGYWEKLGVTEHTIYSNLSSEKNLSYKEALNRNYELIQKDLDELVEIFQQDMISARPNLDHQVLKGKTYKATQALELGLIDQIGSLEDCFEKVNELISTQSNNNETMFGNKFGALTALKGDITPQLVEAANAQLTEQGISGVQLVELTELEEASTSVEILTAQNTALSAQLTTANQEKEGLQTKLDAANVKIEELGEQPGEVPSDAQKTETDEVSSSEDQDWYKEASKLEHNQNADEID